MREVFEVKRLLLLDAGYLSDNDDLIYMTNHCNHLSEQTSCLQRKGQAWPYRVNIYAYTELKPEMIRWVIETSYNRM